MSGDQGRIRFAVEVEHSYYAYYIGSKSELSIEAKPLAPFPIPIAASDSLEMASSEYSLIPLLLLW